MSNDTQEQIAQSQIRNFCIIAHIDHGKSTLADRLLEMTHTVSDREMKEQLLDQMDLEREKGITIKLQPVQMVYKVAGSREHGAGEKKSKKSNKQKDNQKTTNSELKPTDSDDSQGNSNARKKVREESSRKSKVAENNNKNSEHKPVSLDGDQGASKARSAAYSDVRQTSTAASDEDIRQEYQQVSSSAAEQDDMADEFELNLIDTPGHVDFSYEVSRSLNACEGALLVVDAAQGIQAQTIANVYLAIEAGLELIPVINKIDLPAAQPEKVAQEIISLVGCKEEDILQVSAKTGEGVEKVLDAITARVPPPSGEPDAPARALVFDSVYNEYRGVILYVRVVDGQLKSGEDITLMAQNYSGESKEVGVFRPQQIKKDKLETGSIGYVVTDLKSVEEAQVGDTVTLSKNPATEALPGYQDVKSFVFAGFYPTSGDDYPALKDALEKLKLNDASLVYTPENSQVLGFGYRVGFLGLLHMEIVKERIEREFDIDMVVTNPSTDYKVILDNGEKLELSNASEMPDPNHIEEIKEPWIDGEIVVPDEYMGNVMQLIHDVRGQQKNIQYIDETLAVIEFDAPLANVLTDFYDRLKSATSGYGSLNYELSGYRTGELVKLDILVAGDAIDSLSQIVHESEAYDIGSRAVEKLKDVIPRQQFKVSLQAAIGSRVIARENISALRKNVTGDLYGGDVSRKKKLLKRQKEGKKRMKKFGSVEIPPEAFTVMLKRD